MTSSYDELSRELADLNATESAKASALADIRRQKALVRIALMEAGVVERPVSDHAVLRYLERTKGVDVDALRREIRGLANESVPLKDGEHHWHPCGLVLVLADDGRVITVLSADQSGKFVGRKLATGERVEAWQR